MDSRRWDSGAVKKGMCGLDLLKDYGETNGRFQRIFRLMEMVLEIVSLGKIEEIWKLNKSDLDFNHLQDEIAQITRYDF
ncbi:hypothetical protein DY000_02032055 [Brassica cretica]|uniref:Uncharacterized protein n=1 Tax=Brassica cretica TaxID=69181 RepID=A0ABQ7DV33_BRACR|nr:hypothetical protein DY000_02032055 [Brassica cretica]